MVAHLVPNEYEEIRKFVSDPHKYDPYLEALSHIDTQHVNGGIMIDGTLWPEGTDLGQAYLLLWKKYDDYTKAGAKLTKRHYYALAGIRRWLTESEVCFDPWFVTVVRIWTYYPYAAVLGAAACGKSNGFGLLSLLWWALDPDQTLIFVCSTSKEMLKIRIWESVHRYHRILKKRIPNFPGEYSAKSTAIINPMRAGESEDLEDGGKAGIRGVAIQQGTEEEARANLVGGHLPYVVQILDEQQQCRLAGFRAASNLRSGTKNFRQYGLGNPDHETDNLCGVMAKPVQGWENVDENTTHWKTTINSRAFHFNGFRSPAVLVPEFAEKFHYLVNLKGIEENIEKAEGNKDDPLVWAYSVGFPVRSIGGNTILSQADQQRHKVRDPMEDNVFWESTPEVFISVDGAYSAAGDPAIMTVAEAGYVRDPDNPVVAMRRRLLINFRKTQRLAIVAARSSGSDASEVPAVMDQITRQVRAEMESSFPPVPVHNLGTDETGTQTMGDYFELAFAATGVHRFVGSQKPLDRPVSHLNLLPAKEQYRNRAAQAWDTVARFARNGQIRGLSLKAGQQLDRRKILKSKPLVMEPKDTFIANNAGESPNEADGAAILVDMICQRFGVYPGLDVQKEVMDRGMESRGELLQPRDNDEMYVDTGGSGAYAPTDVY